MILTPEAAMDRGYVRLLVVVVGYPPEKILEKIPHYCRVTSAIPNHSQGSILF